MEHKKKTINQTIKTDSTKADTQKSENFNIIENESHDLDNNQNLLNFLNKALTEMLLLPDLESVYKYIVNSLHEQISDTIILCISIDEPNLTTRLEAFAGVGNWIINKIIELSGFNPVGKEYKLHSEHNRYFRSGNFVEFEGGLAKFSDSEFPALIATACEKMLDLHKIYTIGINKDDNLFAAVHFFTFNKKIITDHSFISAFVKQAGLVIQKIQSKLALQQNEEMFRVITENSADALFIVDKNGCYFYSNQAALNLLGYSFDELTNLKIIDTIPEGEIEFYAKKFQILLREGKLFTEVRMMKKDGTIFPAELNTVVLPNDLLYASIRDITERNLEHKKLIESEAKFRSLFDNAPDAAIIVNIDTGIILDANQAAARLLMFSIEKIIGMHQSQIHPPENKELSINNFNLQKNIDDNKLLFPFENKIIRPDGTTVPVEISASKINIDDKMYVLGIFRDITARKFAEDELKKKVAQLEHFNELMVDREVRMIAMKKEINQLLNQLGEKNRY